MNVKIYDRACKYVDKMLFSRRDNWCLKRLYISSNLYLHIRIERVTLDDIANGVYQEWERGTPNFMELLIVDMDGKRLGGRIVQYAFEREYKYDLDKLLGMYGG